MRIRIANIGNSRGIILPKSILKQVKLETELNLEVENGKIILSPPVKSAREGWAESFQKLSNFELTEEDKDFMNFGNKFDEEDWTW